MLSTKQAADMLGISQVRVRELLKEGKLAGARIGRSWAVEEDSVAARLACMPKPGRPVPGVPVDSAPTFPLDEIHELYRRCEDLLSGRYDVQMYEELGSGREARFCVKVADFFLQERQRELVEQGVF